MHTCTDSTRVFILDLRVILSHEKLLAITGKMNNIQYRHARYEIERAQQFLIAYNIQIGSVYVLIYCHQRFFKWIDVEGSIPTVEQIAKIWNKPASVLHAFRMLNGVCIISMGVRYFLYPFPRHMPFLHLLNARPLSLKLSTQGSIP